MIESVKPTVVSASCDACGAALKFAGCGVEHGLLANKFGFDTPALDQMGEILPRRKAHLCPACHTKACVAVGLDPCTLRRVGPLGGAA
jgi:hypothetical protein